MRMYGMKGMFIILEDDRNIQTKQRCRFNSQPSIKLKVNLFK